MHITPRVGSSSRVAPTIVQRWLPRNGNGPGPIAIHGFTGPGSSGSRPTVAGTLGLRMLTGLCRERCEGSTEHLRKGLGHWKALTHHHGLRGEVRVVLAEYWQPAVKHEDDSFAMW